jgi:uncharacterized lipoprotein YddW (UPF0748 family)
VAAGLLASAWAAVASAVPPPAPVETRALWVVRTALVSPAEVDRVVDQAADAGFNTLLVQVRGRGDAFYTSRLVSRSPLLARQPLSFDPLERLVIRARSRGLAVHAWINVLLAAHFRQPLPEGHILAKHPEWVMVPKSAAGAALRATPDVLRTLVTDHAKEDADVEGLYLSPSNDKVADHLTKVVEELASGYPLDGLHLDFIRYPGVDYDYSRSALESFRAATRGQKGLLVLPATGSVAFAQHRRGVLTTLVSRLAGAARTVRPGLVISAAVAPGDNEAVAMKGQAWGEWLQNGLLDVACPMAYATEDRAYAQQVTQVLARGVESGRPVWVGIGAWRLSMDVVVGRVLSARKAGAAGVALFSHESLGEGDLRRLRKEAFPPDSRETQHLTLGTR